MTALAGIHELHVGRSGEGACAVSAGDGALTRLSQVAAGAFLREPFALSMAMAARFALAICWAFSR
jgi:hypothetical protein